jgi:hypothetical protein
MPVEVDLHHALRGFTGTEAYHQHWLPHVVLTDGVAYLMEHGNCYWLVDAIASHLRRPSVVAKTHGERFATFHLWTLRKFPDGGGPNAAILEAKEDTDEPILIRQVIPYTDFQFEDGDKTFKLFAAATELEEGKTVYVLMLPSEY